MGTAALQWAWGDIETRGGLRGSKGGEPARPMPTRSPGVTSQPADGEGPQHNPTLAVPADPCLAPPQTQDPQEWRGQTPPPPFPSISPLGGELTGSRLQWEPVCVVWEAEVVQAPDTVGPEMPQGLH